MVTLDQIINRLDAEISIFRNELMKDNNPVIREHHAELCGIYNELVGYESQRMSLTYLSDEGGEWEAFFINGKLVDQNHSLYVGHVLEDIARHSDGSIVLHSDEVDFEKIGRAEDTVLETYAELERVNGN